MKTHLAIISLVLIASVVVINLSLRSFATDGMPKGWFKSGSNPQNYEMTVDTAVRHGGKASARIKFIGNNAEGFGTLMQTSKADDFLGQRLRMSAWMKTEDANAAELWLRMGSAKGMLALDNMENRPVQGTTEWKKYELTMDVPSTTVELAFGAFVSGKGQLWVDDFSFAVVGKEVPTTNMITGEENEGPPPAPSTQQPANLDFEGGGPSPVQNIGGGDFIPQGVGADRVFTGKQVTQKPQILAKPDPNYTEEARKNQITGTVLLQAVFTARGEVTQIRVLLGLPHGLTDQAIAAAKRIKFTPAMKDGKAVSMYMHLEYTFNPTPDPKPR